MSSTPSALLDRRHLSTALTISAPLVVFYFLQAAQTVLFAWIAADSLHSMALAGRLFMITNGMQLVAGPIIAVFADRVGGKLSGMAGSMALILSYASLSALGLTGRLSAPSLAAAAFLAAFGQCLLYPTLEALVQLKSSSGENITAIVSKNVLRQIGLIGGTAVGGMMVGMIGTQGCLCALTGIGIAGCCLVVAVFPRGEQVKQSQTQDFRESLVEGLRAIMAPGMIIPASILILAWAISQATNATLAAHVSSQRLGAGVYGTADSFWSIGAFLATLLATPVAASAGSALAALALLTLNACALAALSYANSGIGVIASLCVVGALYGSSKLIADVMITKMCTAANVGRVRSNLSAISSIVGLVIYGLPSLITTLGPGDWLRVWGMVIAFSVISLALASAARFGLFSRQPA